MKLFLSANKNETPPADTVDLLGIDDKGKRYVYASMMADLFFDENRPLYNRLRAGEEVAIEIVET